MAAGASDGFILRTIPAEEGFAFSPFYVRRERGNGVMADGHRICGPSRKGTVLPLIFVIAGKKQHILRIMVSVASIAETERYPGGPWIGSWWFAPVIEGNGDEELPPPSRRDGRSGSIFYKVVNAALTDEESRVDAPNFFVHGEGYTLPRRSLFCLSDENPIRRKLVWLCKHPAFDYTVLGIIFVNSIILGMANFGAVNSDGTLSNRSWRNWLLHHTEIAFTVLFTLEMLIKVSALGFFLDKNSYLRDPWNILDFVVVLFACVAFASLVSHPQSPWNPCGCRYGCDGRLFSNIPGIPNISILRVIRVLRPLRTLNALPGLRLMVQALLQSIPPLMSVLAFALFFFIIWGVLGVQLFMGRLQARCRVTEFPVRFVNASDGLGPCAFEGRDACRGILLDEDILESNAGLETKFSEQAQMYVNVAVNDSLLERCLPGEPSDDDSWRKNSDSPWSTPRDCFWPIDPEPELERVCSLDGSGAYSCDPGRWCGNNWDRWGNRRFEDDYVMQFPTFNEELHFGFTGFDHIAIASYTIFQSITFEKWAFVYYRAMDAFQAYVSSLYFLSLETIGVLFLLSLFLAVISDQFDKQKEQLAAQQAKVGRRRSSSSSGSKTRARDSKSDERPEQSNPNQQEVGKAGPTSGDGGAVVPTAPPPREPVVSPHGSDASGRPLAGAAIPEGTSKQVMRKRLQAPPKTFEEWQVREVERLGLGSFRRKLFFLVTHPWFDHLVVLLVVGNTILLAVDHYPMNDNVAIRIETGNFFFAMAFVLEMIVKLTGLGFREFARDRTNLLDAAIVIASVVEVSIAPPGFLTPEEGDVGGNASISALRSLRLLRVFALARSWHSLNVLLQTIGRTIKDVAYFFGLLVVFMFVFSLIGMNLFANKLCFDEETELAVPTFQDPDIRCPEPFQYPRIHFDNLLWSFVSTFLIIMQENWNELAYDCILGVGWGAISFFILVIVLGTFTMYNLFIAILLSNFQDVEQLEKEARARKRRRRPDRPSSRQVLQKLGRSMRNLLKGNDEPAPSSPTSREGSDTNSMGLSPMVDEHVDEKQAGVEFGVPSRKQDVAVGSYTGLAETTAGLSAGSAEGAGAISDGVAPAAAGGSGSGSGSGSGGERGHAEGARGGPESQPDSASEGDRSLSPELIAVASVSDDDDEEEDEPGGGEDEAAAHGSSRNMNEDSGGDMNDASGSSTSDDSSDATPRLHQFRVHRRSRIQRVRPPSVPPPPPLTRRCKSEGSQAVEDQTAREPPVSLSLQRLSTTGNRNEVSPPRPTRKQERRRRRSSIMDEMMGTLGGRQLTAPAQSERQRRVQFAEQITESTETEESPRKRTERDSDTNEDDDGGEGWPETGRRWSGRSKRSMSFGLQRMSNAAMSSIASQQSIGPLRENSLGCLSTTHPVRLWADWIARNDWFNRFILTLIVFSSVLLAVDTPFVDPGSALGRTIRAFDIIFAAAFTIEAGIKIVAWGFVMHQHSYLRSAWNQLDFVIVVVSLISLGGGAAASELRAFRSLRVFRALRPLRFIGRREGMRVVVNALLASFRAMGTVMFVCFLVFLLYAIVGVHQFKGTFYECDFDDAPEAVQEAITFTVPYKAFDPIVGTPGEESFVNLTSFFSPEGLDAFQGRFRNRAPTSRQMCEWMGFEWEMDDPSNFDNVGIALGTLIQISTTEGWPEVLEGTVDARGTDMQPIRDNNVWWCFYSVSFLFIGSLFITNLFVGVVIENFNRMKEKLGGFGVLLTEEQREWAKTQKVMLRVRPVKRPQEPSGSVRALAFRLAMAEWFDWSVMVAIVVNTMLMMMHFWGEPYRYRQALDGLNLFFAVLFTLEAAIKILAFGKRYFESGWNRFDFVVVLLTDIGIIVQLSSGFDVGSVAAVVRTIRIARVFRLLKHFKVLNHIFNTLIFSLPSMMNAGAVLLLVIYIYAVMGVQLFGTTMFGGDLNPQANFRTFWRAFVTMVRTSTGEDWFDVMHDIGEEYDKENCIVLAELDFDEKKDFCGFSDAPDCEPLPGCGTWLAYPFFYSFTVLVTFAVLNLFVAVVLEGFSETDEDDPHSLSDTNVRIFTDMWMDYDPEATCYISSEDLMQLLERLPAPMGFPKGPFSSGAAALRRATQMNVPLYEGNVVHYADVSLALAKKVFTERARLRGKAQFSLPVAPRYVVQEWLRLFPMHRPETSYDLEDYVAAKAIEQQLLDFMGRHVSSRRREGAAAGQGTSTTTASSTVQGRRDGGHQLDSQDESVPSHDGSMFRSDRSLIVHQEAVGEVEEKEQEEGEEEGEGSREDHGEVELAVLPGRGSDWMVNEPGPLATVRENSQSKSPEEE